MKKFKKNENTGVKKALIIVSICLVVSLVIARAMSYAVYQKTDEIPFINARVGHFETSSSDIELAMKLDGEDVDVPPSKDNYVVTIECDHADGIWESADDKWGAYIYNISSNKVKCNVNFKTPEPTLSEVKAKSTRTSINLSYTAEGIGTSTTCKYGLAENVYDKETTSVTNENCNITELEMNTTYYYQICAINGGGKTCKEGNIKTNPEGLPVEIGDYISMTPTSTSYTIPKSLTGYKDDTIKPSELNLWRVINKNEDGTVDVVSEYVSSSLFTPLGQTGYMNFVGILNTVAAQYTNEKYVEKTRHMGYNDQIEWCTEISNCPATGNYQKDVDLVEKALGRLSANKVGGSVVSYWIASRYNSGIIGGIGIYNNGVTWQRMDALSQYYGPGISVRPILTLKSDIQIINGDGKSADTAYQLS